jgi:hypothetical protein
MRRAMGRKPSKKIFKPRDELWDNNLFHLLVVLTGNDSEGVNMLMLMVDPNSGEVK